MGNVFMHFENEAVERLSNAAGYANRQCRHPESIVIEVGYLVITIRARTRYTSSSVTRSVGWTEFVLAKTNILITEINHILDDLRIPDRGEREYG